MVTEVLVDAEDDVVADGDLRAPFPWFGGKRRVAPEVWERFGQVDTYNEPFFGSGAVLLARPHAPRIETINDLDCYVANFWRALQHDPEAVAYYADGPVNEADLHARHRWLVSRGRRRVLRCREDPHYFSAKIAGWWVWGQCLWIGSGWCAHSDKRNQHPSEQRKKARVGDVGVHKKRPKMREAGTDGVAMHGFDDQRTAATRSGENPSLQRKRPAINGNGESGGVHRRWQGGGQGGGSGVHSPRLTADWQQRPDLADAAGRGIHAPRLTQQLPALNGDSGASGHGIHASGFELRTGGLYAYMYELAARLRRVRVCCGDWKRVLTPSVTTYIGVTGVFLDPPYQHDLRERCYAEDHNISADVRAWALAHGDDPKMRIALCGYEGEHEMPDTWECVKWKAHGGYSRTDRGRENRERERIWFSPHCLKGAQPSLLDLLTLGQPS